MIKKWLVIGMFCALAVVPAIAAEASDPRDARIAALEDQNRKMAGEIERLHQEIRNLNETLQRIREQAGGGGYWPN